MTFRELTCLIRLFQSCADPAIRRRAVELVPELAEWDDHHHKVIAIKGDPVNRMSWNGRSLTESKI